MSNWMQMSSMSMSKALDAKIAGATKDAVGVCRQEISQGLCYYSICDEVVHAKVNALSLKRVLRRQQV